MAIPWTGLLATFSSHHLQNFLGITFAPLEDIITNSEVPENIIWGKKKEIEYKTHLLVPSLCYSVQISNCVYVLPHKKMTGFLRYPWYKTERKKYTKYLTHRLSHPIFTPVVENVLSIMTFCTTERRQDLRSLTTQPVSIEQSWPMGWNLCHF